ncbi:hypothetical protein GCM10020000_24930 [Streptomyces olivoverticillatus]
MLGDFGGPQGLEDGDELLGAATPVPGAGAHRGVLRLRAQAQPDVEAAPPENRSSVASCLARTGGAA